MNNKYFTPNIEDIRIGYECEYTTDGLAFEINNTDDISKDKLGILDVEFLLKTLYELGAEDELYKHIRVSYLTKEQIENEGLKFDTKLTVRTNRYIKDKYTLIYTEETHRLRIANETIEDKMLYQLFDGDCPSINELRYISKLTKIKQ